MRIFADCRLRRVILAVFLAFLCCRMGAETLTFIAQFDPYSGETNRSWFIGDNWFETGPDGGLVQAGRVPLAGEEAIITGSVELGVTGIRVKSLTLTNGASLTGGVVAVERVRMQGGSLFQDATVNVLTSFDVDGTQCMLSGGTLTILAIAQGHVNLAARPGASLVLTNGAVVSVNGTLSMADFTRITAIGPVPSRLNLAGLLVSTNSVFIGADTGSKLIIDNSGIIRARAGTLLLEAGEIEWRSSAGVSHFDAAETNASIFFSSAFQVPESCASYFTGPGTNWFGSPAIVDGALRIGMPGSGEEGIAAGNLSIHASVSGAGDLRVAGNGTNGAALIWSSGTLSLPIEVAGGAAMSIGQGTGKSLSSCIVSNFGMCTLAETTVEFERGAIFENLPGARFEVQGAGEFLGEPLPGGGAFNNRGIFRKAGPGIASFGSTNLAVGPEFNNLGLTEITEGALRLATGSNGGDFRVSSGAELGFWGAGYEFYEGTDFLGEGDVTIANDLEPARVRILGRSTAGRLEVGANGVLAGQGITVFPRAAVKTLIVSSNGALADLGVSTLNLQLREQGVLTNADVSVAEALSISGRSAMLRRSALRLEPSAAATVGEADDPVGALLRLEGSSFLNSGTLSLSENSTLMGDLGSIVRALPGSVLSGAGTLDVPVQNSGTIRPLGVLTLAGGKPIDLEASGRVVIALGATNLTVPHDQLRILGDVELDGTLVLEFAEGFQPQSSQVFEVVAYGSAEGRFARIEGQALPGMVWTSTYASTGLRIALQRQAEVGAVRMSQGQVSFPFPTAPGTVYLVQASSDLGTWETIQIIDGDGTIRTFAEAPTHPRRYYRVLIQ